MAQSTIRVWDSVRERQYSCCVCKLTRPRAKSRNPSKNTCVESHRRIALGFKVPVVAKDESLNCTVPLHGDPVVSIHQSTHRRMTLKRYCRPSAGRRLTFVAVSQRNQARLDGSPTKAHRTSTRRHNDAAASQITTSGDTVGKYMDLSTSIETARKG